MSVDKIIKKNEKKMKKQSLSQKVYEFLFKDISIVQGLNSMLLIILLIIFIKFFLVGIEQELLKSFFEILVCFGIIIILLSIVPVYTEGFFAITNILLLFGGVIYFVNDNYGLVKFSFRLSIVFSFCWFIFKITDYFGDRKVIKSKKTNYILHHHKVYKG